MKLLVEQKEKLEESIKRLKKEEQELHENRKLFSDYISDEITGRAKSDEKKEYDIALQTKRKLRESYENLLKDAEIVTKFNNEQIDIGTKFVLEFSDGFKEQYTLVESKTAVSSLDGYLTVYSPIGQRIYQKKPGEVIQCSQENETVKIVEIIPKKDLKLKVEKKSKIIPTVSLELPHELQDSSKESQLQKKTPKKNYFPGESICKAYRTYEKQLKEEQESESAKKELVLLDNLTFAQKNYLREYLRKLNFAKSQLTNHSEVVAYLNKINQIQKILEKKIIRPQTSYQVELGQQVLLEATKGKTTNVLDCELIPRCYGDEEKHGFLSIRSIEGFFAYHAKMGNKIQLSRLSKEVRVAQFGINRNDLLFPLSANLTKLSNQEELETESRVYEIQQQFPKMTISQKILLDREFEKLSHEENSNYQEYLQYIKEQIKAGNLLIQTEEELNQNGDQAGLGSQVTYIFVEDGKLKISTKELIWNAYTTESKEAYAELQSDLGANLFGKRTKDEVKIPYRGKIMDGQILTVYNRPYIKTNYTNLPNTIYRKIK